MATPIAARARPTATLPSTSSSPIVPRLFSRRWRRVIAGSSPQHVLLGMSFLSRVDMDNRGNVLLLRSKF